MTAVLLHNGILPARLESVLAFIFCRVQIAECILTEVRMMSGMIGFMVCDREM
jgi:hypothetical protein